MKSVAIITNKGPFGSNHTNEAIRLGSGFLGLGEDIDCKLILTDDAVLFLKKDMDPGQIGMDSIDQGIEMADLTEMTIVLVREDMERRGITESDLIDYDELSIVSEKELSAIVNQYDSVFKM